MNKNIKRILTLALVMVMVAAFAIPVMAATGGSPQKDANGDTYLGTNQPTSAKITKYVVVGENVVGPKSFTDFTGTISLAD